MSEDMFSEATEEARKEMGIAEEPPKEEVAPETAPEEKTEAVEQEAAPAEEPTPEPEKPEEADLSLSAEQLDAINKDENLRAAYKSMQRGLTKKSQEFADERKAHADKIALANFLEKDPEAALQILAEKAGRKLAPTEPETTREEAVDTLLSEWTEAFQGNEEAAKQFYPLLKKTIESMYDTKIQPVVQNQEAIQAEAAQRAIATEINKFGSEVVAKGQQFDTVIQNEMSEMMTNLQPSEGVPLPQYLDSLYSAVMFKRFQASNTKAALQRLRAAETETEPTSVTRTTPTTPKGISSDMTEDEAIAAAVELAELDAQNR
jgi:hypothetical protein